MQLRVTLGLGLGLRVAVQVQASNPAFVPALDGHDLYGHDQSCFFGDTASACRVSISVLPCVQAFGAVCSPGIASAHMLAHARNLQQQQQLLSMRQRPIIQQAPHYAEASAAYGPRLPSSTMPLGLAGPVRQVINL